ncbi:MAG: hypothetical protein ABFS34_04770 [Gemmatimonadota bacterium]
MNVAVEASAVGSAPEVLPKEVAIIRRWATEVEDNTRVMMEMGLFKDLSGYLETILARLREAREYLQEGQIPLAREQIGLAEAVLSQASDEQSWGWRAVHVHQVHLLIFHVAVAVILLNISTRWWIFGNLSTVLFGVPVDILLLGALGATLRGSFWLYRKVQTETFRAQFTVGHLAAPVIGALFALLVYLVFRGGLVALAEGGNPQSGEWALKALAFVAGFSWEWALQRLEPVFTATSHRGSALARQPATKPDTAGGAAQAGEATEEVAPTRKVAAARVPSRPSRPSGRATPPPQPPATPAQVGP